MNFYRFHIGDYIKQTVHLTPIEDICYRRLIDMYYETENPIPTETDRVSRRLRLDTELVETVLKEFFTLTENGWENARCNKEIDAYHTKADAARSNGKLGGRPKKTQPVPDRNQIKTGTKANQEPITTNHKPRKDQNTLSEAGASTSEESSANDPRWTPEDKALADYMLTRVRDVSPSAKGSSNWPDHIRLMRERDRHSHSEIRAMFDWANADAFWRANILSPAKLREKWAQLEAKRNTPRLAGNVHQEAPHERVKRRCEEKYGAPTPFDPILIAGGVK